jgi:CBS domain-containing protein
MSMERQAEEVLRVKRSEYGVIFNPFYLSPENYVYEAEALMAKYRISGVPICDENKKLIGIITNRDMRFLKDFNDKIGDVMTKKNLVTAPVGTTVEEAMLDLDKFIDGVLRTGLNEITIIHGKGTGALRKGIHTYLRKHPNIRTFRVGTFGEGEEGVTIAELK